MADVSYRIIRSDRKTVSLEITKQGEVLVRAPRRMPDRQIECFVLEKKAWLEKHLAKRAAVPQNPPFTPEEVQTFIKRAKAEIPPLVERYASMMGVTYGRVTIRSQRTRWGSCSTKGNLNLNCLLVLLPSQVRDYIIVHELCHRKEMNHSARFWAEVAAVMPSYKTHETWLKQNGNAWIRRLP